MPICNGIVGLEVTYGRAMGSSGFHRLSHGDDGGSLNNGEGGDVFLWYKNGRRGAFRDLRVIRTAPTSPDAVCPDLPPDDYVRVERNLLAAASADSGAATHVWVSSSAGPAGEDQYIVGLAVLYDDEAPPEGYTKLTPSITHTGKPVFLAIRRGVLEGDREVAPAEWSANTLQVGDSVDCLDRVDNWCKATVVAVTDTDVRVHFQGWSAAADENIRKSSDRLAKPGTRVTGRRAATKGKRKQGVQWALSPEVLEEVSSRVAAVQDGTLPEEDREYFLEFQLPNFVEKCLVSRFRDRDMVPLVHKFLQGVVRMIAAALASPKPLSPSLPTMLDQLFDGDRACSWWFSHYGLGSRSAAPGVDVDSGHVAVPKQKDTAGYAHMYYGSTYNNPMAGRDVRLYLLDIINAFTAAGGFTAYLDRLNVHPVGAGGGGDGATVPASGAGVPASGNDRGVAPLSEILSMTLAIHSASPRLHSSFRQQLLRDVRDATFARLAACSDRDLRTLSMEDVHEVLTAVKDMAKPIKGHTAKADLNRGIELTTLNLAIRMLTSPAVAAQARGMDQLVELVAMTQRAAAYSYGSGVSAKWLKPAWLATYLVDNHVPDIILGKPATAASDGGVGAPGGDSGEEGGKTEGDAVQCALPQVVHRSPPVLEFMTRNHKLSQGSVDRVWALLRAPDETIAAAASQTLSLILKHLSRSGLEAFGERLKQVPRCNYDVTVVTLIRQFSEAKFRSLAGADDEVGLSLLWAVMQDDAPVPPAVSSAAQTELVRLMRRPVARDHVRTYLEFCVSNLETGSSVEQSLQLAERLLGLLPAHGLTTRSTVLQDLNKRCGFVDQLVGNLATYKWRALHSAAQMRGVEISKGGDGGGAGAGAGAGGDDSGAVATPADVQEALLALSGDALAPLRGDDDGAGLASAVLVGKYPHVEAVRSRLNFLRYVLLQSRQGLEFPVVQRLWHFLVVLSLCGGETESFLEWLQNGLPKELAPSSTYWSRDAHAVGPTSLKDGARAKVFDELLCGPSSLTGGGLPALRCFIAYFRFFNIKRRTMKLVRVLPRSGIRPEFNFQVLKDPSELVGVDEVWAMALTAKTRDVSKHASEFLIALHTQLSATADTQAANATFLSACITRLNEVQQPLHASDGSEGAAAVSGGAGGEAGAGAAGGPTTEARQAANRATSAVLSLLASFLRKMHINLAAAEEADAKRKQVMDNRARAAAGVGGVRKPVAQPKAHEMRLHVSVFKKRVHHVRLDPIVDKNVTIGEIRDVVAAKLKHPANQVRIVLSGSTMTGDQPVAAALDCMALADLQVSRTLRVYMLQRPEDDTKEHALPAAEESKAAEDSKDGDDSQPDTPRGPGTASTADTSAWDAMYQGYGAAWATVREMPLESTLHAFRPMHILANNDEYFPVVYDLLGAPHADEKLREKVWSLLQLLPSNRGRRQALAELEGGPADVASLLPRNHVQLLYSLQIVEELMRPPAPKQVPSSKAKTGGKTGGVGARAGAGASGGGAGAPASNEAAHRAAEYRAKFVRSGGFARLYALVMDSEVAQWTSTPLARATLSLLVKLACHLLQHAGAGLSGMVTVDLPAFVTRLTLLLHALTRSATGAAPTRSRTTFYREPATEEGITRVGKSLSGRPWRAVEAEGMRWCMAALATACQNPALHDATAGAQPTTDALLQRLYSTTGTGAGADEPLFQASVLTSLLLARHKQVRVQMRKSVTALCTALPPVADEDDSVAPGESGGPVGGGGGAGAGAGAGAAGATLLDSSQPRPEEYLLPVMLEHVADVYTAPDKCREYFAVVKAMVRRAMKHGALDTASVALRMIRRLRNHPVVERTASDEDHVLRGFMSTILELLGAPDRATPGRRSDRTRRTPKARATRSGSMPRPVDLTRQNSMDSLGADQLDLKQEAAALVPHLFRIGLFSMPGESYSAPSSHPSAGGDGGGPAAPPLAKHPATRDLAASLLTALARGSASACATLLQLCASLHSVTEMGADIGARNSFHVKASGGENKSDTGYVGIKNLGCICYMNSTLQQLYNIVPFRNAVLGLRDEDVADSQGIVLQLQRLYTFLKESDAQYYDPTAFCSVAENGSAVDVHQQKDASEFLTMLFTNIERATEGTKSGGLLAKLFGGRTQQDLIADGHSRASHGTFFNILVPVTGMGDLETGLAQTVEAEEVEYSWETGKTDEEGKPQRQRLPTSKRVTYSELPQHLLIGLKRFDIDMVNFVPVKVNERFTFPAVLDMYPYTTEAVHARVEREAQAGEGKASEAKAGDSGESKGSNANEEDVIDFDTPAAVKHTDTKYLYRLAGVVIHIGTATSGHYYSIIRDRSAKDNRWLEFNDKHVRPFPPEDIAREAFGGVEEIGGTTNAAGKVVGGTKVERERNAFLLLYDRIEDDDVASDTETSKRVVLPQQFEAEVNEANRVLWLRRYIMDKGYMKLLSNLVALHPTPMDVTYPTSGEHLRDWMERAELGGVDVLAAPPTGPLSVAENMSLIVAQFATRVLLATLVRLDNKAFMKEWMVLLRSRLQDCVPAAVWLCHYIASKPAVLRDLLVNCTSVEVRLAVIALMRCLLETLAPRERQFYRDGELGAVAKQAGVVQLLAAVLRLMPEAATGVHSDEYFALVKDVVEGDAPERDLVMGHGMLPALIALMKGNVPELRASLAPWFFDEESRLEVAEVVGAGDDAARGASAGAGAGAGAGSGSSPSPGQGKSLAGADMVLSMMVSMVCSAVPPSGRPRREQMRDRPAELSDAMKAQVTSTEFLAGIVDTFTTASQVPQAQQLLTHLCWESKAVSATMLEAVRLQVEARDGEALRCAFTAASALMRIDDSLRQYRVDEVLSTLLVTMMVNQPYIVATEIGLDMLLKIAQKDEMVNRYFNKNAFDWIPEWLATTKGSDFDTTPANYFMHKPVAEGGSEPPRPKVTKNSAGHTPREVLRMSIRERLRTLGSDGKEHLVRPRVGWKEGQDDPHAIVGKRVAIMWSLRGKQRWYKAFIRRYIEETKEHEVVYDDGDISKYDLRDKKIKFFS